MTNKELKPRPNKENTAELSVLKRAEFELRRNMLRQEVLFDIANGNFDDDPYRFQQSLFGSRHPRMLTFYSIEELHTMKTFLVPNYSIGFALRQGIESLEIVNVHNNEPIIRSIGRELLLAAINLGGDTLDHYGSEKLNELYDSVGLVEVRREDFDLRYDEDGGFELTYGRLPVIYRKLLKE